jgi:hypothetical protein
MSDGSNAGPFIAAILAVYLVFIAFVVAIAVVSYVLLGLTLSRFFRKVGVEPWIAWVPYYNHWKWLEVGGHQGWIALLSLVPYGSYVTLVFLAIGNYRTGIAFRKDGSWVVLGIFLPWVWCYLLGRDTEVYEPQLITAAGYPPPLAGFGAVPR